MEHLRRTQGIDPKARSGALMGSVELILKDAVTGRVKEVVRHKNMLTNGLDSAINGCPWGLDQQDFAYNGISGSHWGRSPIHTQLLGGITLYPQALGNNADLLFPPFSNMPTGYASLDSYTQDDPKQGTYDSVSSGAITNGYKHVYDWGSAFGNGQIAALALNPRGAHNWCKNWATAINPTIFAGTGDTQSGMGFTGFGSADTGTFIAAANEDGVLWHRNDGNNVYGWAYSKVPPFAIDLINSYVGYIEAVTPEWIHSQDAGNYNWQFIGTQLAQITRNSATSVTIKKLDMSDGTVDSSDTYTFSGVSFGTGRGCVCDGYLYWAASTAGKIYKCNLSNVADVDEITSTNIPANSHCFYVGSQFVYNNRGIYDTASDVFVETAQNLFGGYAWPILETGIWFVTTSSYSWYSGARKLGASMKNWACMTHADLETAVTKTADKQMIVNYSLLQV